VSEARFGRSIIDPVFVRRHAASNGGGIAIRDCAASYRELR
jgi:hypothetical protein